MVTKVVRRKVKFFIPWWFLAKTQFHCHRPFIFQVTVIKWNFQNFVTLLGSVASFGYCHHFVIWSIKVLWKFSVLFETLIESLKTKINVSLMTSSDRLKLITIQKTKSMSSTFSMLISTHRHARSPLIVVDSTNWPSTDAVDNKDVTDCSTMCQSKIGSFQSLIGQF